MRLFFFLLFCFVLFYQCACAPFTATTKEILIEDCTIATLKVLTRKADIALNAEYYERVVDSCKTMHTGRP